MKHHFREQISPCRPPGSAFLLIFGLLLSLLAGMAPDAWPQVVFNEYLSSNLTGIRDEDRDFSDWIEIYNAGPGPVAMEGHGLSDEEDEPFKWVFPTL